MSKKSVIILWVIALALGISVTTLKLRAPVSGKANTERSRGQTLLDSFPADQVASIQLKGFEKSVTLAKKKNQVGSLLSAVIIPQTLARSTTYFAPSSK